MSVWGGSCVEVGIVGLCGCVGVLVCIGRVVCVCVYSVSVWGV